MRAPFHLWIRFEVLSLLATLSLVVNASTSPTIYWHALPTGLPSNADVEAVVINPATPGTLYAGTFGEGVYRSSDNGATWVTATTGLTLPMSVQNALAVHPLTPTLVYAGDYYGGGLYRSLDSGEHWALVLPGAKLRAVAASPITPGLVLAGDRYDGLYRSADNGDMWTHITATAGLTNTQVNVIALSPSAPYTIYVGAGRFVFGSEDAAVSWQYKGLVPSNIFALAASPLTPTTLLAGTYSHGVYISANAGQTWTASNTGLPAGAWVTALAFDPFTPTLAYAGTWDGQVYRSEDGGSTWAGLNYLGYVYALTVHPIAPGVLFAGTSNNGLFRGSVLDHLTLEPIASTQYVYRPLTLTVTARDALGFPLTGAASAQTSDARLKATLANGYNGAVTLLDSAGVVSTTVNLVNGVGVKSITFNAPIASNVITATLQTEGLQAVSNPFEVVWFAQLYLPLMRR